MAEFYRVLKARLLGDPTGSDYSQNDLRGGDGHRRGFLTGSSRLIRPCVCILLESLPLPKVGDDINGGVLGRKHCIRVDVLGLESTCVGRSPPQIRGARRLRFVPPKVASGECPWCLVRSGAWSQLNRTGPDRVPVSVRQANWQHDCTD
jgi:hypothetical protein